MLKKVNEWGAALNARREKVPRQGEVAIIKSLSYLHASADVFLP